MSRAYFVSDIHLYDSASPDALALIRFMGQLKSKGATHFFLVGDIFDLWVGGHEYFLRKFGPIVEAIRSLRTEGIEVHFFEGNHDFHLKGFWQDEIGIQVHSEAAYFEIAGRTVRVEHGDLINPDDHGYLFVRWFLRSAGMKFLALNRPSKVVQKIGERASRASRHYTSTAKELPVEKIKSLIRSHAEEAYREAPFDLIISGHVHVVDDITFPASGLEVRSVNLGSWFDRPRAFVLDETKAEFIEVGNAK